MFGNAKICDLRLQFRNFRTDTIDRFFHGSFAYFEKSPLSLVFYRRLGLFITINRAAHRYSQLCFSLTFASILKLQIIPIRPLSQLGALINALAVHDKPDYTRQGTSYMA